MRTNLLFLLCYSFLTHFAAAQLKSPEAFLGYELGDQFTRHHQVMEYYRHIAEAAPHVKFMEYGRTYEQRPLTLLFLSSPENMDQLETIRADNMKRAGLLDGETETNIPIIWLSYNVHGNESVSTEAGMATTYELLANRKDWLEEVVVIIDPCINPDGRDRYVNFYWQYGNQPYDPDPQSLELNEPWPRGRANHYLFDLNRDWAWQTQIESQARIKQYNHWLPQIHVDFHEQGVNNPYYFAPAAEPYHELITSWQREFQVQLGKNHAKYFDQENWFYFTKQRFDLLYPSYGDTYPTYSGAIGMTYEQGGSGRAGLGVITQEDDTLTLRDRIAHHYTTGISTVEMGVQSKRQLLSEFEKFYSQGRSNPSGTYKSYVIKAEDQDKINDLAAWLDVQGIEYGTTTGSKKLSGYRYSTSRNESFTISSNDLVISTYQPKSVLANVFFEPNTAYSDSLTYDITAWSIPYAYGLEAYGLSTRLDAPNAPASLAFEENQISENTYAFLLPWKGLKDAQLLSALLKADIKVRVAEKPIAFNSQSFDRGTVVIAKRDNQTLGDNFAKTVVSLANAHERKIVAISTGFAESGPDLGSSDIAYVKKPSIAVLFGEGTGSLDAGAVWHFFEQQLGYPATKLSVEYLSSVDLSAYNVLIAPAGDYRNLSDNHVSMIKSWVEDGGKLIAFQDAIGSFENADFASIEAYNSDEEKAQFEQTKQDKDAQQQLSPYSERERQSIQDEVPGAIFKVKLDNTHPMAFGYDQTYFSLKTENLRYAYLDKGWNVGVIEDTMDHVAGFAGKYVKMGAAQSMVFGTESFGEGDIVYFVDNPLFRAFWYDGKLLICNAIFFVGQ